MMERQGQNILVLVDTWRTLRGPDNLMHHWNNFKFYLASREAEHSKQQQSVSVFSILNEFALIIYVSFNSNQLSNKPDNVQVDDH